MHKLSSEGVVGQTDVMVFKKSLIHGTGGFARVDIAAGQKVIEYLGERISKAESLRRCEQNNEYIFTLNAEEDLDGSMEWNLARFINHSCAPNCDAELVGSRIWIVSRVFIRAGEELTFNYGFDLEDYKQYRCQCGSARCVGFMVAEEYLEHVSRVQR